MFIEKQHQVNNDIVIAYSDTTQIKSQKPVLIFLHGLGGDLAIFDDYRNYFFDLGYRSVAIDFRGHGLSSRVKKREGYSLDVLASDVLSLLKFEKINDYILVGHCLGGLVAQKIAIDNPRGLKKMVLINTTCQIQPFFKIIGLSWLVKVLAKSLENTLPTSYKKGRINHKRYLGSGDFYLPRIFNDINHTSVASYGKIFSFVLNFNIKKYLKNISIPTLVISGNRDLIFPTTLSKQISNNIKNSKLIEYSHGNHLFLFKDVKNVANDIKIFVEDY